MRICYGEVDWRDKSVKQAHVRRLFLKTVAEIVPEVCKGLHKALPAYKRWKEANPHKKWFHGSVDVLSSAAAVVRSEIDQWAVTFNLTVLQINEDGEERWIPPTWVTTAAWHTLERWGAQNGQRRRTLRFYPADVFGGFHPDLREIEKPSPALPDYDPILCSRRFYLEDVKASAARAIDDSDFLRLSGARGRRVLIDGIADKVNDYCNEVENCYLKLNDHFIRCPTNRRNETLGHHLRWAVKYQVQKLSIEQIVNGERPEIIDEHDPSNDDKKTDPSTAFKACVNLLKTIRLSPRRPMKRGRQKGSKNKPKLH